MLGLAVKKAETLNPSRLSRARARARVARDPATPLRFRV